MTEAIVRDPELRLARLEAENTRLRTALQPFADLVEPMEEGHPSWFSDNLGVVVHPLGGKDHTLRFGVFRRAKTALARLP